MRSENCEKCICRLCVKNAENYDDGMCKKCESCAKDGFSDIVRKPHDCENLVFAVWEGD